MPAAHHLCRLSELANQYGIVSTKLPGHHQLVGRNISCQHTTTICFKHLHCQLAEQTEPEVMLDDLFLAAYCRLPRSDERTRLLAAFPADDAVAIWQDIYWAVLNSKEFTFQH